MEVRCVVEAERFITQESWRIKLRRKMLPEQNAG
jgi:hypothetical protein